jgi:subtilase family protein/Calx-beta domain-containing protein/fervidolysin-like protein
VRGVSDMSRWANGFMPDVIRGWRSLVYGIATWATVFALVAALTTVAGVTPAAAAATAPSETGPALAAPSGPSSASTATSKTPVIVKLKGFVTGAEADAMLGALGGEFVRDLPQLHTRVLNVPSDALAAVVTAYGRHPAVERAAAAVSMEQAGAPNDPGYPQQWALPKVSWDKAYGIVPILGAARIAVLDTGIDATHPDLLGRTSPGRSFVGGVAEVDPNGHGTALAGIAAANVNNLVGMAGVAYAGTTVSSVQVLRSDGTGWDSDVVSGIVWAADNGANVILMGFSSANFSAAMQDAVNYASSKGVVLVAATGNKGSSAPSYPAGMANVIGVAATDRNDAVLPTSNTGSAAVAAPGLDIYATLPAATYGVRSGTSMAAAETAGLAALLIASGKSGGAASNQIRGAVDPITGRSFGRINVAKALGAPVAPQPTPTPTATPTPGPTPTYSIGSANLMRLHFGTAAGPENYLFTAGDVIVPEGTVSASSRYKFAVTDPAGGSHGTFACTLAPATPSNPPIDGTSNSYTVQASDPLSSANDWTFTLRQYASTDTTCSGTPTGSNVDSKAFDVAKATAYTDSTLATSTTLYTPGATAYVVVTGDTKNKNNWSVIWIPPGSTDVTATCKNTGGNDRPESANTNDRRLPDSAGSFLQYPPNATATGDDWNRLANYDAGSLCPPLSVANQGQWKLKIQFDSTHFVTLNAFTVTPPTTISINDVSANEGNTGTTPFMFTVSLSSASTQTVTVTYTTADNTATVLDLDYAPATGVVTFLPGQTSQTVTVQVTGDTKSEPNETFFVNLSLPTNATIADGQGVGTIVNDDAQPTISINDVSANEGNGGLTPFTFAVTLSNPSSNTITVTYATADGTATVADLDYVAATGVVTFLPGQTSQPVTVQVTGDTQFEPNETFLVNLTLPTNATIADGQGVGTIVNDDTEPTISINDVSQLEGNAGPTNFNFTVSLSNASSLTVTVNYATADGTATVADGDYVAKTGTVTFVPGTTSQTVSIVVNGDTKFEPDETFFVDLSMPTNATIADGEGQGTIQNDDTQPTISINDVSKLEGNAGPTTFGFTVSLSNASSETVTVSYATADDTATVIDLDYAPGTGVVTFLPGQTSQTVNVIVNGDTKFEPTETFFVNLTLPTNATIADGQGVGTIVNDDTEPTISINDVSQLEGNAGPTDFDFTVSLSNASSLTVTVTYATADNTATVLDLDYAPATGVVTFLPGQTSQTVTVQVTGDTKFEPTETFFVNLTLPTNATIADSQGVGTIQNDDAQPTISINDVSANEGNVGPTSFDFTVSLSNASSQTITVTYATADNTATVADGDYVAKTGTVTFTPGTTTQTVSIVVNGDTKFEPTETFFVNLTLPTNATIADGQGVGTIQNDDAQPTISINDVSQAEGNAGTTSFDFTVTLSNASSLTVTVNYATADDTATVADGDYVAKAGTVTFTPGTTTQTVSILVNGDTKFEPTETFFVNLTLPTNATIADGQGVGTIQNDDTAPTISINDVSANEGNVGPTSFDFTVSLSNASSETVTVHYATADDTASGGATCGPAIDYQSTAGTLTFLPGVTSQQVSVTVCGDTTFEPDETFFVNLTLPTNATIADGQGVGTIQNDDTQPTISINDVSSDEGNAGTTTFSFTVTLNHASSVPTTVNYSTADDTASGAAACAAGVDYQSTAGTLTFAPGITTQQIDVLVCGDTTFEDDETFFVNLSGATNATISDGQGLGTIRNDDAAPTLSIDDVSKAEGNAGTTSFSFTVTLSGASGTSVSVDYDTANGTATGGAACGVGIDYQTQQGTIIFAPGVTTQTIDVLVCGDTKFEPDETFFVNLSNATGATITDGQGKGTIQNDDAEPKPAGKWTGGGRIDVPNGTASFGFNVERKVEGGPIKGELNYVDHVTGMHVKSKTITSFNVVGNTLYFGGDCTETTKDKETKGKDETQCTFNVVAEDNDTKGDKGDKDTFRITVDPPAGYVRGGTLRDGNIKQHSKP